MKILYKQIIVILALGLIPYGCDNGPAPPQEEHTDADGFIFEDENGIEIYREFEGASSGSITLIVGDTLELSVHFLDHDGNEIEHEESEGVDGDEEDELRISGNDSSIASVEVEEHEVEVEEQQEMGIHVIGVSSGSTSFKLELMHGGHADYTSTNFVPVTVNEQN